jgi:hypothetical protein
MATIEEKAPTMDETAWLAAVDRIVSVDLRKSWSRWYSFHAAYVDGLTPTGAVRDFRDWMKGGPSWL